MLTAGAREVVEQRYTIALIAEITGRISAYKAGSTGYEDMPLHVESILISHHYTSKTLCGALHFYNEKVMVKVAKRNKVSDYPPVRGEFLSNVF